MEEISVKFREKVRGKKVVRRTKRKSNEIQAVELMIDSEKIEACTGRINTDTQKTERLTDK